MKKWVYNFDEVSDAETLVGSWDNVRGLLGGKGANLADMVRLGVPVPPGFTITTEACNTYVAADATVPEGMWGQVRTAMLALKLADPVIVQLKRLCTLLKGPVDRRSPCIIFERALRVRSFFLKLFGHLVNRAS